MESSTTETPTTPRRNQRKTPLTPKKRDREDESPPPLPNHQPSRIGGGRIKKAKIPFDPSESNFPKRRMTVFSDSKLEWINSKNHKDSKKSKKKSTESGTIESTATSDNDYQKICVICTKVEKRLGNLTSCKDCVAVAHSSCIRKLDGGQQYTGFGINWICSSCETCVECYETALMQPLYKCSSCNSCYHLECDDPNFTERSRASIQKNKFRCKNCISTENFLRKTKAIDKKNEIRSSSTSTTSSSKSLLLIPATKPTSSASKIPNSDSIVSVKKNLFSSTLNEDASSSSSSDLSSSNKRITEVGFAGFDCNELNQDKNLLLLSDIDDDDDCGVTKGDWDDIIKKDNKVSAKKNLKLTADINNDKDDTKVMIRNEPVQNEDEFVSRSSSLNYLNDQLPHTDTIVKWTKDDVYEYFVKYYPNEAIKLKEKNIDGLALLLMKRDDVIMGLEIKLGPALRMYNQLLCLQMQKNDITLGWM